MVFLYPICIGSLYRNQTASCKAALIIEIYNMKITKLFLAITMIIMTTAYKKPQHRPALNILPERSSTVNIPGQNGISWHSNGKVAFDGMNAWHENGQLAWSGADKTGWHTDGKMAWNSRDENAWHTNGKLGWSGFTKMGWHDNGQLAWNGNGNTGWHKNGQLAGAHIKIGLGPDFILFVDASGVRLYVASKFIHF